MAWLRRLDKDDGDKAEDVPDSRQLCGLCVHFKDEPFTSKYGTPWDGICLVDQTGLPGVDKGSGCFNKPSTFKRMIV